MVRNMHPKNLDHVSKKSKLLVSFALEPVDHSGPEEIKSVEVYFLGQIYSSLKHAFRKARTQFSTDDPHKIILVSDHASCVIKEQMTLNQLMNCCVLIDIEGLLHYLTIIEYNWITFMIKDDDLLRIQLETEMDI